MNFMILIEELRVHKIVTLDKLFSFLSVLNIFVDLLEPFSKKICCYDLCGETNTQLNYLFLRKKFSVFLQSDCLWRRSGRMGRNGTLFFNIYKKSFYSSLFHYGVCLLDPTFSNITALKNLIRSSS